MIRRKADQKVVYVERAQGGEGVTEMHKILEGPEELDGHGRSFNHCFLKKGAGLGHHVHQGTTETLYILSGEAEYTDENGEVTTLTRGDVTFTDSGQGHSIFCTSDEPLEFIALVLFKDE